MGKLDITKGMNGASAMRLELPWPPSSNTYYRTYQGRMLLSKRGRAYKTECHGLILEQHGIFKPFTGPISVTVELTPPDKRKRDLDNCFKGLFDSMANANVMMDDSQIKAIYATMLEPSKPGSCVVIVEEQ